MKKIKFAVVLALAFNAVSCGVMGFTSTPTEYVGAGQEVSVERKNMNILTLTAMDSHKASAEMLEELKSKCPKGITNVRTTHSLKNMWLVTSEKMQMTCNCK
jgi:hypothetical protein